MRSAPTLGALIAVALVGLLAGDGAATSLNGIGANFIRTSAFSETKWPFLRDPWGEGRAFFCNASQCGSEVALFVRTKAGFCNCSRGIEDDDEIDRIGDVDLHGKKYAPIGPGKIVSIGDLAGRARQFRIDDAKSPRQVVAVVVSMKCNALVATLVTDRAISASLERAAVELVRESGIERVVETASVGP